MAVTKAKAKHYSEIMVEDWNVKHFIDFMTAYHRERLGVAYIPVGGFQADAGTMGKLIGTAKKPGLYDKALVYEWLRRCIDTYSPTPQYPGTNLRFMYTYKMNVMQQLERDYKRAAVAKVNENQDFAELEEWL